MVVYRIDDRVFFANASYVKGRLQEAVRGAPTPARWLVVDGEAITHIDSAGLGAIGELTRDLARAGITLLVARLKSGVRHRFDEGGVTAVIGLGHFHPTVRAAVAACQAEDHRPKA